MNFQQQIYDETKGLFPEGEVQTLICRRSGEQPGAFGPAVRLIHTPTGIEISCDEFPSQIENYIAAAIRLRIACDNRIA